MQSMSETYFRRSQNVPKITEVKQFTCIEESEVCICIIRKRKRNLPEKRYIALEMFKFSLLSVLLWMIE